MRETWQSLQALWWDMVVHGRPSEEWVRGGGYAHLSVYLSALLVLLCAARLAQ